MKNIKMLRESYSKLSSTGKVIVWMGTIISLYLILSFCDMDRQAIIGVLGTISSISLGQWNHIVGILAGLFTIVYMTMKMYKGWKK